jgi:flagella basal body P-ring formation protein FlgA
MASRTGSNVESAVGDLTLAEIVDVATIPTSDRDEVMRHLKAVVLTDRPSVGEERTFSQEGLEAIVGEASRRLETAGFTVEWKIPRRSHVLRKNSFSRDLVSAELIREFASQCQGCEVVLRRIDWPKTEGLAIQSWRLVIRNEKPRGSFAVPIEFELAAGKKTLMLTGQVDLFAEVPVTTRSIQGLERLAPADYKTERRNITYSFDAPASPHELAASVASRPLAVGETIWKSTVRREQVLRFGDPVRVQIGGETYSVSSEGIAQGPAALGDTVRVKVGKSQKLLSGILKEKGLVEIE